MESEEIPLLGKDPFDLPISAIAESEREKGVGRTETTMNYVLKPVQFMNQN